MDTKVKFLEFPLRLSKGTAITLLVVLGLSSIVSAEVKQDSSEEETQSVEDYFLQQELIDSLPINIGHEIDVTNYLEPNFVDLGNGGEIETRRGFFNFRARVGSTTVQQRVTPGNSRLRFIVQNGFPYE